jgi:hypothetical protein
MAFFWLLKQLGNHVAIVDLKEMQELIVPQVGHPPQAPHKLLHMDNALLHHAHSLRFHGLSRKEEQFI